MTPTYANDPRVVLTLDAGGTTFRFSATQGGRTVAELPAVPSRGDNLPACLATLLDGFAAVQARCPTPPVAISFAFPGPADYAAGIIGDLPNLPAFRGGVALGSMLEEKFRVPVFVNNDGALFAYGEAGAGFLPFVNELLTGAGSPRRYRNLLGVTLGTGFGGGVVCNGELLIGDNSAAGHVWLLRNKRNHDAHADDGVSIRAVRRVYAKRAGLALEQAPDPKTIAAIARGTAAGDAAAALASYRQLGDIAGDAIAQALTVLDAAVVIGGGLTGAADLFMPALLAAANEVYVDSGSQRRVGPQVVNVDDPESRAAFCHGRPTILVVPGAARTVAHDAMPRVALGLSRCGTSEAIARGAYAFALRQLDHGSCPTGPRPTPPA